MKAIDTFYQEALEILNSQMYCVLSTASLQGEPWISPVFFAFDEKINLFWVSEECSRHSTLVKQNPRLSCVVFNSSATPGEGNAVYFSGGVKIVAEDQLQKPLKLLKARATKSGPFSKYEISDMIAESPWRLYQLTPVNAWILKDKAEVRGWEVDRKQELDLSLVSQAMQKK